MSFPDKPTASFVISCVAGALLMIAVIFVPGCLRSISATPGTTPDGRPMLDVCAELMAKASPSGAPRAVATVAPSAAPTGGL